ncbi:hypothetical protein KCU87_g561, partial [Aureobasidium melanogenum]
MLKGRTRSRSTVDLGGVRTLGRKLNPRLSILDSGGTCARLVESARDNSSRWNKPRHREASKSLCKRSLSVATVGAVPRSVLEDGRSRREGDCTRPAEKTDGRTGGMESVKTSMAVMRQVLSAVACMRLILACLFELWRTNNPVPFRPRFQLSFIDVARSKSISTNTKIFD